MARISQTAADPRALDAAEPVVVPEAPGARLRRLLASPYLTLVSRLLLGAIFLLAGLTKLGVPQAFTASINSYEIPLPDLLVRVMAVGLPPLELGLGIWLILGLFTRFAAALSGGLLVVFLIALLQAVVRGISPECGCFSGGDANSLGMQVVNALGPVGTFLTNEKVGPGVVVRDLIFLAMAVHLIRVPTVFSIDSWRRARIAAETTADLPPEDEEAAGAPE